MHEVGERDHHASAMPGRLEEPSFLADQQPDQEGERSWSRCVRR